MCKIEVCALVNIGIDVICNDMMFNSPVLLDLCVNTGLMMAIF
jgi:hypothetical protein